MAKFILAKKLEMSQMFDENNKVIPITLLEATSCVITQIRTTEKDGYEAVQLGFGESKKINKPLRGHLKDLGNFKYLREFRDRCDLKIGDKIDVSVFEKGDRVMAIGVSKGKGFAGVVKRHGFRGGPASHGNKHSLRAPGSIGSSFPERVIKGKKMAGRMGCDTVTVKNLKVMNINVDNNLIALKGAVPGPRNTLIKIIAY